MAVLFHYFSRFFFIFFENYPEIFYLFTNFNSLNRILKSPFNVIILLLLIIGTFQHFAPFLNYQRLVYSISEDGYYMLTMARNIAAGHGMSIADGTIITNGTQPLMTLILAGVFLLTGGDKIFSIQLIILLQWLIAVAASYMIWKLGSKLLKNHHEGIKISVLAAALWYASPVMIRHTMNGLETGLYAFAVLYVLTFIIFNDNPFNFHNSIVTGFLLGIVFLIRNDAVFLIGGVCLVFLIPGFYSKEIKYSKRLVSVIVVGIISLLTAGPWLLYNQMVFGWIVPISGQAEMFGERVGGNFINLPRILSEYFTGFIPLSYGAQKYLPVLLSWIIFILAIAVLIVIMYKKFNIYQKRLVFISGIFLILLSGFYSTAFDHYYFLPRYLFPATPIIILGWAAAVFYGFDKFKVKFTKIREVSTIVFVISIIIFSYVRFNDANKHMHFQVVDWVKNNVSDDIWISAFQSGAVGYFHDKTINLDGKVNPYALRSKKLNKIPQYMVKIKAVYMADWYDRKWWMNDSTISNNFEMVVSDSLKNITVLKKKQ